MNGHRRFKLKKYAENPYCFYCGRKMLLTDVSEFHGKPDPLTCTVEHLVSRYDFRRWLKAKPGEIRKVLACFECNNGRSAKETQKLTKEELRMRGKGYSLNPRGHPVCNGSVESKEELFARLQERGIEVIRFDNI